MNRSRERVASLLAVGGWVAAFVALWALAGCLTILVYRDEQISDHRCLRDLPLPAGYLQTGLIALALSAALGVATLLLRSGRGPRFRRAAIAGIAILGSLAVATIVQYSTASTPGPMRTDACTGSTLDYTEGLT